MRKGNVVKVIWIDDDIKNRTEIANNLMKENEKLIIDLIDPFSFESATDFDADLYLVDFFLDRVKINDSKFHSLGLALAKKIRKKKSKLPIYCLTADFEGLLENGFYQAKKAFNRIFKLDEIQDNGSKILYQDILDFRKIRKCDSKMQLLKLLNSTKEIRNEIEKNTAPFQNSEEVRSKSFSRWVLEELIVTPGLLYDSLHMSTYLGIKIRSFKTYEDKIIKAKYNGIFSDINKIWWVNRIDEILLNEKEKLNDTEKKKMFYSKLKINEDDQAICGICNKKFPNIIGINIDNQEDLRQIHYDCCCEIKRTTKGKLFQDSYFFKI